MEDITSTNPTAQAQSIVYAQTIENSNISQRDKMIDAINKASQYEQRQRLENMPDEFLADLQKRRINVANRNVGVYLSSIRKMYGLERA